MEITLKNGMFLIQLAREAAVRYVIEGVRVVRPSPIDPVLEEKSGVFVTLNKLNGKEKALRGCIGFPTPVKPLVDATIEAAVLAATEDPRFKKVSSEEFAMITFDVSVLTPPEEIKVKSPLELPERITVGSDGLIVKWTFGSGLLLPQVAVGYEWDAEEFLTHTCMKAGASPDAWLLPDTTVHKFQAYIFEELEPKGRIVEKKLT